MSGPGRRGRRMATAAAAAALSASAAGSAGAVSCTISGATLAFGSYNAISKAEVDTSTPITLTCTGPGTVNFTVSLSPGQSGSETARALASGANRLSYQVYQDSGHTTVFGDGAGGTSTFSYSWTVPSGSSSLSGSAYGVIPSGQNPKPGAYADTLTLLVTY